ncbi:MAG: diguanylate cyclase, partial [Gammaproteobacteria bacterium]|nr:diguanylate cyclase [Gammaproteobacteria bacterium]
MIIKSSLATRFNNLNKTSLLLIASFSAILIVTVTALGLVLHQTKTTQFQANQIVTSNNKKAKLLVDMQQIARERSLTLYRLINIKDPFKYDETLIEFQHYAELFIKARETFVQMSLSEEEKQLIASQSRLSGIAVPIQHQIIALLNQENYSAANELLVQKAIPAQDAVLNEMSKLLKLQYDNNKKIIIDLQNELNQHVVIIILSAFFIFILTILIAYKVVNKISQTEKQLFYEKELAQITLHSIGDGVITVDKNYLIKTINPVAEMLVGKNRHSLLGSNISLIYKSKKEKQQSIASENLTQINIQRSLFDFTFTHNDGAKFEVENTIAPIIDQEKNILGAVIILRDVTEMRSMEKRLSYQASHDSLTKLINRREFEIRLEQTIRNAHTEHNSHSICFLDLDKFKIINDTSGHAAGDEFLKQISKTIHASLRQTDVLARLGGD